MDFPTMSWSIHVLSAAPVDFDDRGSRALSLDLHSGLQVAGLAPMLSRSHG